MIGDRSSGPFIAATLDARLYPGRFSTTLPVDRLDDYATLWTSLGVYPANVVVDSSAPEGPAIMNYLANGGCVYLEGGDSWAYDPQFGGFDFGPAFGIIGVEDGGGDLSHVLGATGELSEGMDFAYAGENSFIDRLGATGSGIPVLRNSSPQYDCGVASDTGSYRTVGTSFELGGLQDGGGPSTRGVLARAIMDFFQVPPKDVLFADGFESGGTSAWIAVGPATP